MGQDATAHDVELCVCILNYSNSTACMDEFEIIKSELILHGPVSSHNYHIKASTMSYIQISHYVVLSISPNRDI